MPAGDATPRKRSSSILLAAQFLFPVRARDHADDEAWTRASRWFVPWGLVIGLIYMLAYRVAWKIFGEYEQLRLVPAIAVLVVDQAFCGYRLVQGTARVATGAGTRDGPPPALTLPAVLAVVLILLARFAMLVYLPVGAVRPQEHWRTFFRWLYPDVVYCPLMLMPLWGRWAMMLALATGRVAPQAAPRLKLMAGGQRLWMIMLLWGGGLALTVLYCCPELRETPRGVVMSLGVMFVAYVAAFTLARRAGGQTEATLGAVAVAAELSFLAFYLPNARAIYLY